MRPSAGLTEALVTVSRAAVNFKKKTVAAVDLMYFVAMWSVDGVPTGRAAVRARARAIERAFVSDPELSRQKWNILVRVFIFIFAAAGT